MNDILTNEKKFSVIFFGLLVIDILVKLYSPSFPYRYISKPSIVLMLFFYYYVNTKKSLKKNHLCVILTLGSFLMGDIFMINYTNILFLSASLFFFTMGKVFLSLRICHKYDFEISRLVPLSIILSAYSVFIVSFLYDSLGLFFLPALISFFISILLIQFAFLRKGIVDKTSYLYVFFGVVLYMLSESMLAVEIFKTDIPLQDPLIMLLYGIALYLITMGIVKEKRTRILINPF